MPKNVDIETRCIKPISIIQHYFYFTIHFLLLYFSECLITTEIHKSDYCCSQSPTSGVGGCSLTRGAVRSEAKAMDSSNKSKTSFRSCSWWKIWSSARLLWNTLETLFGSMTLHPLNGKARASHYYAFDMLASHSCYFIHRFFFFYLSLNRLRVDVE